MSSCRWPTRPSYERHTLPGGHCTCRQRGAEWLQHRLGFPPDLSRSAGRGRLFHAPKHTLMVNLRRSARVQSTADLLSVDTPHCFAAMTLIVHDWETLSAARAVGEPCRIEGFHGDFRFLSNFFPSAIEFGRILYPTVEHAYQAAKSDSRAERQAIAALPSAGGAKRAGSKLTLREGWNEAKVGVMTELLRLKFMSHLELRDLLLATGAALLVEANTWGDTFWGVCGGVGENHLGRLLMQVRTEVLT